MPLQPDIQIKLESIINSLINLQTSGSNNQPKRFYSYLFRDLPDKKEYSDYYLLIKDPKSLNGIMDSLKRGNYSSPVAVAYELFLVWSNAREYNEAGSMVYTDAEKLENYMAKLWDQNTPPLPPFNNLPTPAKMAALSKGSTASTSTGDGGGEKKKHKHKKHRDHKEHREHKSEHKHGDHKPSISSSSVGLKLTLPSLSSQQQQQPLASTSKLILNTNSSSTPAPAPLRTTAKLRIAQPVEPISTTPIASTSTPSFTLKFGGPPKSSTISTPTPSSSSSSTIRIPSSSSSSKIPPQPLPQPSPKVTTKPIVAIPKPVVPTYTPHFPPPASIKVEETAPSRKRIRSPSVTISSAPTTIPTPSPLNPSTSLASTSTIIAPPLQSKPALVVPYETRKDRRAREKAAKLAAATERFNLAAAARTNEEDEIATNGMRSAAEQLEMLNKLDMIPDVDPGWMSGDVGEDSITFYLGIVNVLKTHTDASGRILSQPLMEIPDRTERPDYYQLVDRPNSLTIITHRVEAGEYTSPMMFDQDLHHLFGIGKSFITLASNPVLYADLIILQRLYQELTKFITPLRLSLSPAVLAQKAIASVPAGPGNLTSNKLSDSDLKGIVSPRVTLKDKTFLTSINYKGMSIRAGDWVHILNPDNPIKPIIAQIFKVFKRTGSNQRCMSVCWYYRPEETIHPATRMFYENEVFKTSNFVDHSIEDLVERCFVMFFTKFVRGRPAPPAFIPGMPIYVCEHRYKDDGSSFKKIKSWNSSIPEEVRKNEYEFVPFQGDKVDHLRRVTSPLLRGVTGPGMFGEATEVEDEDQARYHSTGNQHQNQQHYQQQLQQQQLQLQLQQQQNINYGSNPAVMAMDVDVPSNGFVRGGMAPVTGLTPVEIAISSESFYELPHLIQSKFRHDDSGDLIWFTSPAPAIVPTSIPTHSLDYLYFKAQKALKLSKGKSSVIQMNGNGYRGEDVEMM